MRKYVFENTVSAVIYSECINNTLQELWCGFCFRAGNIEFAESDELIFKIGDVTVPKLVGNEKYAFQITERGICGTAVNKESLIRGFLKLIQKIKPLNLDEGSEKFFLECGEIRDTFDIKIRMVHLCVFPETDLDFLKKTVRYCGILGYTHIILEFWGMLKYDCLKELSWPQAYSKEQAKALIDEIRAVGAEPVPMFNMLGHAAGSRMMSGKHVVLDQNPRLQPLFFEDGWVWDFRNAKTVELMCKIRYELYELFGNGHFIHIGCDEAHECGRNYDLSNAFCDYITSATTEILEKEHRRPIMWADMLLSSNGCGLKSEPGSGYEFWCADGRIADKILSGLDKKVILADWQYAVKSAPMVTTKYLHEQGFDVLSCPWSDTYNVKACVDTARQLGSLGVMDTTWHTLNDCWYSLFDCAFYCDEENFGRELDPWVIKSGKMAAVSRKLLSDYSEYEQCGWIGKQK